MISNLYLFAALLAKVGWMCGFIPSAILISLISRRERKPGRAVSQLAKFVTSTATSSPRRKAA